MGPGFRGDDDMPATACRLIAYCSATCLPEPEGCRAAPANWRSASVIQSRCGNQTLNCCARGTLAQCGTYSPAHSSASTPPCSTRSLRNASRMKSRRRGAGPRNTSVHVVAPGTEHDAPDLRPDRGHRAHAARLQRGVQHRTTQFRGLQMLAGAADRDHLRMRGGIVPQFHLVARLADHRAVDNHHAADRVGACARLALRANSMRAAHPSLIVRSISMRASLPSAAAGASSRLRDRRQTLRPRRNITGLRCPAPARTVPLCTIWPCSPAPDCSPER